MEKPFKAYVVSDDEESVVRYAQHAIVARRDGAYELDEDFGYVTCRRAPEFDALYPKGPTDLEKFESGWRFECSLCCHGSVYCDTGMYSEGRYYCEGCIDGFTEMRSISTPEWLQPFLGGIYTLKEGKWSDEPYLLSELPLKASGQQTPYVWYSPFR